MVHPCTITPLVAKKGRHITNFVVEVVTGCSMSLFSGCAPQKQINYHTKYI